MLNLDAGTHSCRDGDALDESAFDTRWFLSIQAGEEAGCVFSNLLFAK